MKKVFFSLVMLSLGPVLFGKEAVGNTGTVAFQDRLPWVSVRCTALDSQKLPKKNEFTWISQIPEFSKMVSLPIAHAKEKSDPIFSDLFLGVKCDREKNGSLRLTVSPHLTHLDGRSFKSIGVFAIAEGVFSGNEGGLSFVFAKDGFGDLICELSFYRKEI